MSPRSFSLGFHALWLIGGFFFFREGELLAADKAKIQLAIGKAQNYLLQQKLGGPEGAIAAMALIKSGTDKKNPTISKVIEEVVAKTKSGTYTPVEHHIYEAGVDLMLLEAADSELYRPQIQIIADDLMAKQQPNGSWFYPTVKDTDSGDTSISQYAVLGLWAASRAGIVIPNEVFENLVRWHVAKQRSDGGFCYHPFEARVVINPDFTTSSSTMTAAGSSSLLIARRILFGESDMDSDVRPADTKKRFGVLERFQEEKKPVSRGPVTLNVASIDAALKNSIKWINNHYEDRSNRREVWFAYHLYCIERVAALMDVVKIGNHDWYELGSDELVLRQTADGSWNDLCRPVPATAMGLMFLTKATQTIITPKRRIAMLGGGLQAGGRGLPDNLDAVDVTDGNLKARKIVGEVDNLLIELERSSDAKVEELQAAVVELVQLDRPDQLIGQVARLRKLSTDNRPEVRRTAIWALGRSGDLSGAPNLIKALSDPDLAIAREASLALSILARRPEGCGLAVDPTEDSQMGLSEASTEAERAAALDKWQAESKRRWNEWYLKNRVYEERDDRSVLKRNNRQ